MNTVYTPDILAEYSNVELYGTCEKQMSLPSQKKEHGSVSVQTVLSKMLECRDIPLFHLLLSTQQLVEFLTHTRHANDI